MPVDVYWADEKDTLRVAKGKSVDVSLYGILVEVSVPVPCNTEAVVRLGGVKIKAKARIRRCYDVCSWYRVAIEFEETLLAESIPMLNETLIKSLRAAGGHDHPASLRGLAIDTPFRHRAASEPPVSSAPKPAR